MTESSGTPPRESGAWNASPRDTLAVQLGRRTGRDCLEWLLGQPAAGALVRTLSEQDLYWLIKAAGPEESAWLLELASEEQWLYLLDLEIWAKDRLDPGAVGRWLIRLIQADATRLIDWLFGEEGELLAYAYLSQFLDVFIPEPDARHLIPEGYSSLDGVHFFRIRNPDLRPALERLLRLLALRDPIRSASFLETLAGLLPGEAEEELYRFRNARLAEKGFRPFEEAAAVYAPLEPELLHGDPPLPASRIDEVEQPPVPLLPLSRAGAESLLARLAARITDPLLLDRLRLEFATLTNQVLSAEGRPGIEPADLLGACHKAQAYVSLALEATAADPEEAESLLRRHHLVAVFRVGVGLVMRLKRELERWLGESWFRRSGYPDSLWGEAWEGVLAGLRQKRPLYSTDQAGKTPSRDFARLAEVEECRLVLRRLRLLDRLLQALTSRHPPEPGYLRAPAATFHPLLFNGWARLFGGRPASLQELEPAETRAFLGAWQAAIRASVTGGQVVETAFVEALASRLPDLGNEDASVLRENPGPALPGVRRGVRRRGAAGSRPALLPPPGHPPSRLSVPGLRVSAPAWDSRQNRQRQYVSAGWGSGGAKRHSTEIRSSMARAKFVNSRRCISLHRYSASPRFFRASCVGQAGTERRISFSRSSIR